MTVALTNAVSDKLAVLYPAVDIERARHQHDAYCDALRRNGATVRRLSLNVEHGDGCFIEDNAIVCDDELRKILEPLYYRVTAVHVADGLHLKTAVTALDASTLLANSEWVDMAVFDRRRPDMSEPDF